MGRKKAHAPEEIVAKLRQVEVLVGQGKTVADAFRSLFNDPIYQAMEGDQKLTDLTDQELFFEVPIAEVLAKHNEVRKATVDKKQADKFGRDIYLEPARIRDLKMVVVNVAQF